MSYILYNDADYFYEGAMGISQIANDDRPKTTCEKLCAKYPAFSTEIEGYYDPIIRISEHIEKNIDFSDENLHFFFAKVEGMDFPPWTFFLTGGENGHPTQENIKHAVLSVFDDEHMMPEIDGMDALFTYLRGKDVSLHIKARLEYMALNYYELLETLRGYINKAKALILEKEYMVREIIDETVEILKSTLEHDGLEGLFSTNGLPVSFDGKGNFNIHPQFLLSNSMAVFGGTKEGEFDLYWGSGLLKILRFSNMDIFSQEILTEALKVFSDKTKFEMLRLLANDTLYGTQLAERLGISSATVSHHISQLTSLSLVNIVKDANRIYYRLNKERLTGYLDEIKNRLIGG